MIYTGGNSIVGAYTNGVSVKEIYANGVKVWPEHYIIWTPSTLEDTFSINGVTYNMSDYGGKFTAYDGVITQSAFQSTGIVTLDTDAYLIESKAFDDCKSLTQVSLPVCTRLYNNAFAYCTSLTQVSLPVCKYIGDYAFEYCSKLSQISLPSCSRIRTLTFASCASLSQVSLPVCKYIGQVAFMYCTSLTQISLPACSSIDNAAFEYCTRLSQVNLPVCEYIASFTFWDCISLRKITLGYSSVCVLNDSVFTSTPIESGTGSIYVPSSLVDAYKSAQYWSQYSSRIYPIQ